MSGSYRKKQSSLLLTAAFWLSYSCLLYTSYELDDDAQIQSIMREIEGEASALSVTLEALKDAWNGSPALWQAVENTSANVSSLRGKAVAVSYTHLDVYKRQPLRRI